MTGLMARLAARATGRPIRGPEPLRAPAIPRFGQVEGSLEDGEVLVAAPGVEAPPTETRAAETANDAGPAVTANDADPAVSAAGDAPPGTVEQREVRDVPEAPPRPRAGDEGAPGNRRPVAAVPADSPAEAPRDAPPRPPAPGAVGHDAAPPEGDAPAKAAPYPPPAAGPPRPPRTDPSPKGPVSRQPVTPPYPTRTETPPQTPVSSQPAVPAAGPSAPEPAVPPPGPARPPEPPSLSIGRIDVIFEAPPPTPAPRRHPVQRTRGFKGFENARLGLRR